MANNQITPFQLTDQFTMDNFNQRINETNIALQKKAPAGYGLGDVAMWLRPTDDLNNIKTTGWYRWFDSPINAPGDFGAMTVVVTGEDGSLVQEVVFVLPEFNGTYNFNVNCKVRRVCYENTWQPWEWVNPPMMLGKEYRTTERYLGKPVYVKTKEISALAIGSSSSPARTDINNFTDTCDKIVRYEMYVTPASGGAKFPIPYIDSTTGVLKASGSLNEGQYLYGSIYSFGDLSGYKAMVTCWYTKITD